MTSKLRVALLGGLEIALGAERVTGFRCGKSRALLSYLMTTGRAYSREALSALLWDESTEQQARASLRTVLWDLRLCLPGFVVADRGMVFFDSAAPHWFDVAEFRAGLDLLVGSRNRSADPSPLLTRDDVIAAEKALSLYRGEFLADFRIRVPSGFEQWVTDRQRWARRLAAQGWHRLGEHYIKEQRYLDAVDALTQALAINPWWEKAHRQLMQLLALSGQRAAALVQYDRCCTALKEGLGVEPTIETRLLYSRIRSGRTPGVPRLGGAPGRAVRDSVVTHAVPAEQAPLVGRDREFVELTELLSSASSRFVALVGPPGVGKTCLAREAAEHTKGAFRDGIRFVRDARSVPWPGSFVHLESSVADVQATRDQDLACRPALILALVRTLDVNPIDGCSFAASLIDYLCRREMLLVFDDLHPTRGDLAWLHNLLQRAPLVRVLVVCDAPLAEGLLCNYHLRGLPVPPCSRAAGLDSWGGDDALTLFAQRARRAYPASDLNPSAARDVRRICQLVAGVPLAVNLVASSAGGLPLDEAVRRLERSRRAVIVKGSQRDGTHIAAAVAFRYAWELLDYAEQAILSKLALFEHDFDQDASCEIAGVSVADLRRLSGAGWLSRIGTDRYLLHPYLRQGVLSTSRSADRCGRGEGRRANLSSLKPRWGAYYLSYVRNRESWLISAQARAASEQIESDWPNVRRAWIEAAATADLGILDSCLKGLTRFLLRKRWFREGERLLAITFDTRDAGASRLLSARLLTNRARLLNEEARWGDAAEAARTALGFVSRRGDSHGRWQSAAAEALIEWGRTLHLQGRCGSATVRLSKALSLMSDDTPSELRARARHYLGAACLTRERFEEALEHMTNALRLYESVDHSPGRSGVHTDLGFLAIQTWHHASAESHLQQALVLAREIRDPRAECAVRNYLGRLASDRGDYDRATACFETALRTAQDLGDRPMQANVLIGLALLLLRQGKAQQAWKRSLLAAQIARHLGTGAREAQAWLVAGHVFSELRMYDQAERAYDSSLQLQRRVGQSNSAAEALAGLAHVSLKRNDLDRAQALVEQILERLPAGPPLGANEPGRLFLMCYEVLSAQQDARAEEMLERTRRRFHALDESAPAPKWSENALRAVEDAAHP